LLTTKPKKEKGQKKTKQLAQKDVPPNYNPEFTSVPKKPPLKKGAPKKGAPKKGPKKKRPTKEPITLGDVIEVKVKEKKPKPKVDDLSPPKKLEKRKIY